MITPRQMSASVPAIVRMLGEMEAGEAQAALGGYIANILGGIPDARWTEMFLEAGLPCGRKDCGCETLRREVFRALDQLRTDWQEQTGPTP